MAQLYKVEVGTQVTLVKARGPVAARKAALRDAGITVTKATPDDIYLLAASGCKLVDDTGIVVEESNDE